MAAGDKKNNDVKFNPMESLADLRHEFGEHGGVNMSIETSATFTVMQADELPKLFQGKLGPDAGGYYLYGRHFNPTVYVLGRQLAALENTEAAYCTSSGMGAISSVIIQLCEPGDHIVASNTLYGGTFALLNEFLPRKNSINTSFVDMTNLKSVEAAFTERTKILYVESLSNPTLAVADIGGLAEIAGRHNAKLVVDNTFSPLILAPANLGADIVIHSLTKFINGASDIIGGAVCGDHELIRSMMDLHQGSLMLLGPTMDPRAAFSISLRLPHLGMRMAEHSRRALIFSQRLEELKLPVIYPGLTSHPQHELLKKMINEEFGYGGILALDMGSTARANKFMELLQNQDRFGYIAVSLGYFDTLMSCSSSSTSCELSEEAQSQAGISPGLVRFSLGYTGSLEQRWKQLTDALNCLDSGS